MAELLWTVPTRVAPRPTFDPSVRDDRPGRFTAFDEYVQVARAAEFAGFDGVLVPHDVGGDESWVIATAIAQESPRLHVVIELPSDLGTAVYAAKLALSFERLLGDRLSWQIALGDGADPALNDHLAGPARDRRVAELLTVTRGLFGEAPFTFAGDFFEVEAGGFFDSTGSVPGLAGLVRRPTAHPRVLLGGRRDEDLQLSARHADVHLFDEARPEQLAAAIEEINRLAAAEGRTITPGLRLGVVGRDSDAEARRELSRATGTVQEGPLWEVQPGRAHEVAFDSSPTGAQARYVVAGSHEAVAEHLGAYVELGIDTFVLEGIHPVADAYAFGEYVRPLFHGARVPV